MEDRKRGRSPQVSLSTRTSGDVRGGDGKHVGEQAPLKGQGSEATACPLELSTSLPEMPPNGSAHRDQQGIHLSGHRAVRSSVFRPPAQRGGKAKGSQSLPGSLACSPCIVTCQPGRKKVPSPEPKFLSDRSHRPAPRRERDPTPQGQPHAVPAQVTWPPGLGPLTWATSLSRGAGGQGG